MKFWIYKYFEEDEAEYNVKDAKNIGHMCSHFFKDDHWFDFPNVKILDEEKQFRKRNIPKIINIDLNESVNFRTNTSHLKFLYNSMLNN